MQKKVTKKKVVSDATMGDVTLNDSSILGQFEGMCADAEITNENGLDITRPVWENVFASDEYKKAIENGYYIGYLGHPDDPNCMEFEHACIVMKEGHIADDGKIYGKFDLINTPVGKIVKTFIDAGVTFGISVRGAGDIIDNSVDPDTFIFRGFDLVTFPAYKEAVPTFTEVAASSDIETKRKYKAVCAAVRKNVDSLNTVASVDILQSQFAKQSEEYAILESRKKELECADDVDDTSMEDESIEAQKIACMTDMYLDAKQELKEVKAALKKANKKVSVLQSQLVQTKKDCTRKMATVRRVCASQNAELQDALFEKTNQYQVIKASSNRMKNELIDVKESSSRLKDDSNRLISECTKLRRESKDLKSELAELKSISASQKVEINKLEKSNLIYKQKIEATETDIRSKDSVISKLRSELRETVTAATEAEATTSNRDELIKSLKEEITAATKLVQQYQDAYANLYANAIGVRIENVSVTSATTVDELKSIINSSSSMSANSSSVEPTDFEDIVDFDNFGDESMVTL